MQPFDIGEGMMYGTRLSTIILVRLDGSVRLMEKDIFQLDNGKPINGKESREFSFNIEAKPSPS